MKIKHILNSNLIRQNACREIMQAPDGWVSLLGPATRTEDQNSMQWPILQCFADQLQWPVNGVMRKLEPEDWKDILTAAFMQEQSNIAQGLNGGIVMLGQRTRKFNKKQFSEWIEFLLYVAAERGVDLHDKQRT